MKPKKANPPPKETCLQLAKFYWDIRRPDMSWDFLFLWGFYEMYLSWWDDDAR
jgi:hypothetical protein